MTHVTYTRTGISCRTLRSIIEYGLPLPFLLLREGRGGKKDKGRGEGRGGNLLLRRGGRGKGESCFLALKGTDPLRILEP